MDMKKLLKRFGLFITILLLTVDIFATEVSMVEKQLSDCEKLHGNELVSAGNELMHTFYEEKLTDTQIVFSTNDNPQFINQQMWYWASEYFYAHQAYPQALKYGLQALPLCSNDEDRANYLSLISLIYFRQSNYEQAANYAKQCYKLDEKSGDPDVMSSSLNTLAGIYIGANQPKEAEQYILKGIKLAKQANNPARMAVLQGMASEVYHALGDAKEALKYINEACKLEQKLGNEHKLMVRLSQKASVLIGLHDYKEAKSLLNQVIPYLEKVGDKQSLAISCNKMGMALMGENRNDEAVWYYRKAADIFANIGDRGNEMHSRKGLYECLWSSNPDSAKIELNRFNDLKDSLYNMASAESLARYNAEFGSDWLLHENELQKEKNQKTIIWGVIILVLLVGVVWLLMRRKMRLREVALQTIINGLQPQAPKEIAIEQEELSAFDQELLDRLVNEVKINMVDGIVSIEALASKLCITRGQLNRRIKSITGVTTQQYVLRIRLEHARLLLVDNKEMPISEVAMKCGFEDATSFSRAFRRTFEKSPSQYRNER